MIDLGTGCGILPLLLSQTAKAHSFVGVEIQKGLVECAKKNVVLNHLEDRISILKQDFRKLKEIFPPGSFDVALSNPPYREYRTGRINPSMEKAIARHEIKGNLEDLISIASYLLPPKGRCYLIFPALRTVDLFVALRNGKLEPKRIRFVHPRVGEEAKFILTESLKASGVELKIMRPLILEEPSPSADEREDQRRTPERGLRSEQDALLFRLTMIRERDNIFSMNLLAVEPFLSEQTDLFV